MSLFRDIDLNFVAEYDQLLHLLISSLNKKLNVASQLDLSQSVNMSENLDGGLLLVMLKSFIKFFCSARLAVDGCDQHHEASAHFLELPTKG